MTGTCDVHYPYKINTYNSGGLVGTNTASVYVVASKLDNDVVTISLHNDTVLFTTPATMSTSSYTQLLQMANLTDGTRLHFMGVYDDAPWNAAQINFIGYGQFVNGDYEFLPTNEMQFILNGGFLHCRPYNLNPDGSGFFTVGDFRTLRPLGQAITIPTLMC